MIKRLAIIAVSAGLLAIPTATAASAKTAAPTQIINATLNFMWAGDGSGSTGLHLNTTDHTFTTDDGGVGNWRYDPATGRIQMQYTVGCLPLYSGTVNSPTTASGTMNCTDGSDGHGTWNATRPRGTNGGTGKSYGPR